MKERRGPPDEVDTLGGFVGDPGQVLAGRYRILGVLGQGGMGTVYRVRDTALDEVVALKTLRTEWIARPGALERFRREVKLARRVTHPNVARTFDLGEHEGEPFLTMELVEGRSLGRELEVAGTLPAARSAAIAAGIAEALGAAHAVGVVHRDLKPDNVLLGADGRVVITDFGIARVDSGEPGATAAGVMVGTPTYMSPEQVEGSPVDGRSDLYALGLVLYELLTGRRAFDGPTALAVAMARLLRPPPDPRRVEPSVPAPLAELTLRLLSRDPAGRPSVRDVLAVLRGPIEPARAADGPRPRAPGGDRTLAVHPLRNGGPDEDRWIAEGLTDDLFDALCTIPGVRTKARTTVLPGETPHDHGRRAGVELLLEGSVRRTGETVRLVLRLTAVADGFQVWADRIECRVGELLAVSDRVGGAVATAIGRSLPAAPARASVDSGAVELYLRARELQRSLAFGWKEAATLLARAHRLAPDDPTIAATYADVLCAGSFDPQEPGEDRLGDARRAAERALDVAPHLPEPWYAVARVRYNGGDTVGAVRALRRALAQGPSLAPAHDLVGRILVEVDRLDEGRVFLEHALAIDASLGWATTDLVRVAAFRGEWDRAIELLRGLDDVPEFSVMAGMRLSLWLGRRVMEVRPVTIDVAETEPVLSLVLRVASGGALTAEDRRTLGTFPEALRGLPRPTRLYHQLAAECLLRSGEPDAGLEHVRRSVAAGLEDLAWLRSCPLLAPLHARGALAPELAAVERRALDIGRAWDRSGALGSA